MAVGSSIYILFFMLIGLGLGRETNRIVRLFWLHPLIVGLMALVLLGIAFGAVWLWRRTAKQ